MSLMPSLMFENILKTVCILKKLHTALVLAGFFFEMFVETHGTSLRSIGASSLNILNTVNFN